MSVATRARPTQPSEVETSLTRIRERLRRTSPRDQRLRVMLVLAHEALRERARTDDAIAAVGLGPAPAEAGEQGEIGAADYKQLIARIHEISARVIPPDARVLVVSKGDDALLAGDCDAAHFPQGPNGVYAGHYPSGGAAAVTHLEHCKAAGGGEFLLIPATAYWWLDYYGEFAQHLLSAGRVAHHDEHCLIFDLRPQPERRFAK